MPSRKWLTAIVLSLALLLAATEPDAAARKGSTAPKFKPNSIDIDYGEPQSAEHRSIYEMLKERRALEKIRDVLAPLRLPHRLVVQTRSCDGIANAWSDESSVTVCYEYIDEILKNAPERTTPAGVSPVDAVIGPFVDVFLHETGHAVFRALKIPLFGREEDAADQFSIYIMLRFDKDESRRLILGSAYQYKGDLSSPTVMMTQQKFADEHGTPAQRFFNLLCMAYGADPKLFGDVVRGGFLPEERAAGCQSEYAQVSYAFKTLIGPFVDKGLAQRLYKRWLPSASTEPQPRRSSVVAP
jgi:hypothetical protein